MIRPATAPDPRWALAISIAMVVVGVLAVGVMAFVPSGRTNAAAALGLSASLGLGVGTAMLVRAGRSRPRLRRADEVARLIEPIFDDSYALILAPHLPGVSNDLCALLVGPPGVRALLWRHWQGHYRVRGRRWEYDTRSPRTGWIPCRTNPSFDADDVAGAVAAWARDAADEPALPLAAAVVFPRPHSSVVLEEPDGEVVTTDNAPWWGQRIGRLQRMDAARVARFVQAVIDAGDVGPSSVRTAVERSA